MLENSIVEECPNCHGKEYTRIMTSNSDSNLITRESGVIAPYVCLNCGTVYIDKNEINTIKKSIERRKEYFEKKKTEKLI